MILRHTIFHYNLKISNFFKIVQSCTGFLGVAGPSPTPLLVHKILVVFKSSFTWHFSPWYAHMGQNMHNVFLKKLIHLVIHTSETYKAFQV